MLPYRARLADVTTDQSTQIAILRSQVAALARNAPAARRPARKNPRVARPASTTRSFGTSPTTPDLHDVERGRIAPRDNIQSFFGHVRWNWAPFAILVPLDGRIVLPWAAQKQVRRAQGLAVVAEWRPVSAAHAFRYDRAYGSPVGDPPVAFERADRSTRRPGTAEIPAKQQNTVDAGARRSPEIARAASVALHDRQGPQPVAKNRRQPRPR